MDNYTVYHRKAKRRVRAKKGFYYHLGVYLIMGLFFFSMNMATDGFRDVWFVFPLIPWGAGLLIHYLVVFGLPGTRILSKDWEERQYEKEMQKLDYRYSDKKQALPTGLHSDPLQFDELKTMYQENWNKKDFV